GRHERAAGERLDVQGLRVLAVDPVTNAAQPHEVVQVLCDGGAACHLRDRATNDRVSSRSKAYPTDVRTPLTVFARARSRADVGREVLASEGGAGGDKVGGCDLEDDPATGVAGAGPERHDPIRRR